MDSNKDLKDSLQKKLNTHGYGFQFAVLKRAQELFEQKKSEWVFEVSEFPVLCDKGTRIDFVLKHKDLDIYLLAECKRADPKYSNWCFVRSPFIRTKRNTEYFFVENVVFLREPFMPPSEDEIRVQAEGRRLDFGHLEKAFHLGITIKSQGKTGDSGGGRDAIEDAVSQICRGLGGMVNHYKTKYKLEKDNLILIPLVFTTAQLFTSNVNLSDANIIDGKVEIKEEMLDPQKYIFYQYPISPEIRHSVRMESSFFEISKTLDYEYIRTIPIVSSDGIEEFLSMFNSDWIGQLIENPVV